jgi:hypothetical protein
VSGHKPGLLPGRCHHPVFPLQQLPAVDEGPLAFGQGGVQFLQGEVQFVDSDQLFFYGDALGPDQGLFGSALGQVGAPFFLSFRFHLAVRLWSCRVVAAFHNAALSPEVRRAPFRCLSSFCVIAMISLPAGGGSASTLCFISTPGWAYNW